MALAGRGGPPRRRAALPRLPRPPRLRGVPLRRLLRPPGAGARLLGRRAGGAVPCPLRRALLGHRRAHRAGALQPPRPRIAGPQSGPRLRHPGRPLRDQPRLLRRPGRPPQRRRRLPRRDGRRVGRVAPVTAQCPLRTPKQELGRGTQTRPQPAGVPRSSSCLSVLSSVLVAPLRGVTRLRTLRVHSLGLPAGPAKRNQRGALEDSSHRGAVGRGESIAT